MTRNFPLNQDLGMHVTRTSSSIAVRGIDMPKKKHNAIIFGYNLLTSLQYILVYVFTGATNGQEEDSDQKNNKLVTFDYQITALC